MRDYQHFLFYSKKIEADRLLLDPDEAHHAANVLRLAANDPFLATDGNGAVYSCTFDSQTTQGLWGTIRGRDMRERIVPGLHVQAGLPEKAPFESLLTDLTAQGVGRITPLVCAYCQKPWWENDWKKISERLTAKMVAAMKQSLYPWLPKLDPPTAFGLASDSIKGPCLVADPEGVSIKTALAELPPGVQSITAIVGPPGGFEIQELFALKEQGAIGVKIAGTRLTTELAAVVMSGLITGSFL